MKNLKILLALLVVSVNVFAENLSKDEKTRTGFSSNPYTNCSRFGTQFRAYALQPIASNLSYAAQAVPLPLPSPNWEIFEIKPKYHFGFAIAAHSFIRDRNTLLSAHWMHFNHSDKAFHEVPSTDDMVGPFFAIGPDTSPYKQTAGNVSFNFNTISINYGQLVDLADYFQATIFAGINITKIKQKLFSEFSNPGKTILRSITIPTTFTGAGPQTGLDLFYHLGKNFCFMANVTTSILIGKLKNKTIYQSVSPDLQPLNITPPNTQTTTTQNKTQIVPEFDSKLGIIYIAELCEAYTVKVEAGYQALLYINPIQSVDMGSQVILLPTTVTDTVGVFARTFRTTLSNFGLAGPYAGFGLFF